jgi:hypothetical protein
MHGLHLALGQSRAGDGLGTQAKQKAENRGGESGKARNTGQQGLFSDWIIQRRKGESGFSNSTHNAATGQSDPHFNMLHGRSKAETHQEAGKTVPGRREPLILIKLADARHALRATFAKAAEY